MRKFLAWLDDQLLFIYSGFLLAFIPLFPKLPLFDALPGYIVRVRMEDFLVGIAIIIWVIQLWRKKAKFGPNPLAKPVIAYLVVGILSMLSAVFIIHTVPMVPLHIGKMALHFLRRVEYFSLFFVFFSSVKSLKQVKIYLGILLATIVGVILYGYGQKYLYWPAFSTMNREFSKGWALYLTQHARVLSTFGGHYDLAAYTMIVLIWLWSLFFGVEKKMHKILVFVVLGAAFWLLILTASRTSFLAYLAGVSVMLFWWMFRKGFRWAAGRWVFVMVLSILVMLSFGDLSERFTKLLKLDQRLAGIKSLLLRPAGTPPSGGNIAFLENNTAAVTSKSDFPPLPQRPTDVLENIPDLISTQSATGSTTISEIPRTYSQNALVYDLSTGIRLDALWPRAIAGFKKNILLGSGYSTLTKINVADFTEAESTDNDYLRALGETGLLGFLAFGWILATALVFIWKAFLHVKDKILFGFLLTLAAGIFALLVNAVYIDIFESSKVAFSFWALLGIGMGGIRVVGLDKEKFPGMISALNFKKMQSNLKKFLQKVLRSSITYLVLLIILAFGLRYYKIHEPLADWHSWRQADTSAVTRNFVRYGINMLYPIYDDLSSVASGQPNLHGYRFVEFPIYNAFSVVTDKLFPGGGVEYAGRLTSIFASLGTLVFLYLLVRKYLGTRTAWLAALFFAVLPYNVFWSRVVLPEPTLVFFTTAMLYFFDRWVESDKKRFWILSLIFGASALLIKFTAVFFVFPFVYIAWYRWGKRMFVNPWLYLYAALMVIPFFVWRWHIGHYPEGIPAFTWLFNGNGIRFKGAWFQWLFAERIAKLILGSWGVVLLGLGLTRTISNIAATVSKIANKLLHTQSKGKWMFHFWGLGMLAYLVVFATGNVQHDYYQIILVPVLCIFMAKGADWLWSNSSPQINPIMSKMVLGVSVVFMLMFGWYLARDLYNINHPEIVEAGREFDRRVPNTKVLVIAPYNGDTAFLYQTGRRGWPLVEKSIDYLIEQGADYYISTNYDFTTNELLKQAEEYKTGKGFHPYRVIKQTEDYVIVQLVLDNQLPQ